MCDTTREVPVFQLKTLDGRFITFQQSIDRLQRPLVVIDVFSVNMQRQSTVKIGFKDIQNVRNALQVFADAMLEGMCDY